MIHGRILVAAIFIPSGILPAPAANAPAGVSNPEGQSLAAELRATRPAERVDVTGFFKIRDPDGRRTRVPFRYRFVPGEKGWKNIYETQASDRVPAEKLVVIHSEDGPTRYLLTKAAPTSDSPTVELNGDGSMVPFARSDFWLADLGLEFLHWPEQRIVEEAKVRMRKGRPCKVLESINPRPGAEGYVRVRSWIDAEKGQPILAEAYGPDNKLMKEFEIGSLTKVNGQWELKNLEMRNARTDSQTVLEFRYEQKASQ